MGLVMWGGVAATGIFFAVQASVRAGCSCPPGPETLCLHRLTRWRRPGTPLAAQQPVIDLVKGVISPPKEEEKH